MFCTVHRSTSFTARYRKKAAQRHPKTNLKSFIKALNRGGRSEPTKPIVFFESAKLLGKHCSFCRDSLSGPYPIFVSHDYPPGTVAPEHVLPVGNNRIDIVSARCDVRGVPYQPVGFVILASGGD